MAKNLRAKIPEGDRLVVYDRNENATSQFLNEVSSPKSNEGTLKRGTITEAAMNAREVVEKSVSMAPSYPSYIASDDEYVLSMI